MSASIPPDAARLVPRARAECGVLQAIAHSFGADAVCLYEIDRRLNAGDHRLFNLDPESLQLYQQRYARIDPLHPRHATAVGGDVIRLADMVERGRLQRSEYYQRFMQPFGMGDEVEIVLRERGQPVAGLSVIRGAGRPPFDAVSSQWMQAAVPLLRVLLRADPAALDTTVRGLMVDAYGLTERELQIVGMIREGLSNKVIGSRLGISLSTVKTHVHRVLGKLGVASRAGLVAAFFVR